MTEAEADRARLRAGVARVRQAFAKNLGLEVDVITEADRAIVRACLDQSELALSEAREVLRWWETLGSGVKRQYQEFESLAKMLRRNLDTVVEVRHIG